MELIGTNNGLITTNGFTGGSVCWLDPLNPVPSVTEQNTLRFNRNNRNLLGILQLVAKLLEIWFVIIAGGK